MRKKEREIKDRSIIDSIIKNALICRVAFKGDEYPYLVPMNYGFDGTDIFFHCALEGKKLEMIRQNNKVCFEIEQDYEIVKGDVSCDWTTKYRSVIGYGTITIIEDFDQKINALDIIMQQHGKMENAYIERAVNKMNVLQLKIDSITGKEAGNWN